MRKILALIAILFVKLALAQTTDLAISVETRDVNDNQISQAHIFEEFYYLITITNPGSTVSNATFSQTFNSGLTVISYTSINALGGAQLATNLTINSNTLTGTLPNMPASSSVQIKLLVYAPVTAGGISNTSSVEPPSGTTDTNPSSNQSIIATNIYFIDIDFNITQTQIAPSPSTSVVPWGGTATYQFTITNNSGVPFPINSINTYLSLNTLQSNGTIDAKIMSITCMGGVGVNCPSLAITNDPVTEITESQSLMFTHEDFIIFPANGSLTCQVVYKYIDEHQCASVTPENIEVNSLITAGTPNTNINIAYSNVVTTLVPEASFCPCTDVGVTAIITDGLTNNALASWTDEITIQSVVTNNGPEDTYVAAILVNLNMPVVNWQINSINCLNSTSAYTTCADITYTINPNGQQWQSNNFFLEAGASVSFETKITFIEPDCLSSNITYENIKTTKTQTDFDCETSNNIENTVFQLPPASLCSNTDLLVLKTQTDPVLPIGSNSTNPMPWEPVTYEITVINNGEEDTYFTLKEYYNFVTAGVTPNYTGTLLSVSCTGTTGTAQVQPITTANIGVENDSTGEMFFEITEEDNWLLPVNSSVTFEMVIDWDVPCSFQPIPVATKTLVSALDPIFDSNTSNNSITTVTYFATCVDLVVQTYPSSTTVSIDTGFDWIVDISNTGNSAPAINATFETTIADQFTSNGTPYCQVIAGASQCVTNLTVNGSQVSGTIPFLPANGTIRIYIPVTSPNYGGSFSNYAEVQPDIYNNGEMNPSTNISINSVQILAPVLEKEFTPNQIATAQITTLVFTINNITGNPEQNNVTFTDNLPNGLTLVAPPEWDNANGATATFLGTMGDAFIGVQNLHIPAGVSSCTFYAYVTTSNAGEYVNNTTNFNNLYNIDVSNTYASVTVTENPDISLDLGIEKTVDTEAPKLGDQVNFTITLTNLSEVFASNIEVTEPLPAGYNYVTHSATHGTYNGYYWLIPLLQAGETATLNITATVTGIEEYTNTATITALDQVDTNGTNNSAQASVSPDCFTIYNAVSPNGDGFNDYFVIDCIGYYQDNTVKIYNRLGTLIFEQENYNNNWNGIPNRGMLKKANQIVPVGTYYYVITIPQTNQILTGWLYINY